MNRSANTFALLAALVCLSPLLAFRADKKPLNIKTAMTKMKDGLKAIETNAADPKKQAQSLTGVLDLEDAVNGAKLSDPPLAAKQAKDERAAYVRDYRKAMIDLQKDLLDLEAAVLDADADKIKAACDKVNSTRNAGHSKFKPGN